MRKLVVPNCLTFLAIILISGCDTIKSIPTNTTGGLFSLNGTWRLASTTDGTSMVGTTVTVLPIVGNATVKSIGNNSYCVREKDEIWRSVKANGNGGFALSTLVNACNGTTVYKDASIAVAGNDKITVTSRTATNTELVQAWDRIK